MTIAYDNVRTTPAPARWDMHRTLIFSGLMGLMATAQNFGVVFLGMEWLNDPAMMAKIPLDRSHLQTMLFLQLAAGGHMLLFVVRSRGSMISPPLPSAPLFLAVVATQIIAVLMCALRIFGARPSLVAHRDRLGLRPRLDDPHGPRQTRL
jgi:H+-transporting ATPase